ncbi:hypothetical protein STEG23_031069, partial [Scotinomys teguina]
MGKRKRGEEENGPNGKEEIKWKKTEEDGKGKRSLPGYQSVELTTRGQAEQEVIWLAKKGSNEARWNQKLLPLSLRIPKDQLEFMIQQGSWKTVDNDVRRLKKEE